MQQIDILRSIKVPKNQTGFMQLLQLYAQSGHVYWTSGIVHRRSLIPFFMKLQPYRIGRDAPGRAYDKSKGMASTHFVILDSADDFLPWVLIGTQGKQGLADTDMLNIGSVADCSKTPLAWKHYELLHAPKRITRTVKVTLKDGSTRDQKETFSQTTWSWRMSPSRFKEHEVLIVSLAKARDVKRLQAEIQALAMQPQFSGVRGQVIKLFAEATKLAGKLGFKDSIATPSLPVMRRLPIYQQPPHTVAHIVTHSGR